MKYFYKVVIFLISLLLTILAITQNAEVLGMKNVHQMVFNREIENLPLVLPRRPNNFSLNRSSLTVNTTPSWLSCPDSISPTAIWTMATTEKYVRGAVVLGWSIRSFWNVTRYGPLPDLRVIVLHPNPYPASWPSLEKAGWGICHLPRIEPPKGQESKRTKDSYSKLHIFNMTDYRTLLYIEPDTLLKKDIGSFMEKTERLIQPASNELGPRMVGGLSRIDNHVNTGVIIIRPDWEEYMWLINILYMGKVPVAKLIYMDQSLLNHVYSKEDFVYFDWTQVVVISTKGRKKELWKEIENNFTIIHFAGPNKPWSCKLVECEEWRELEKKIKLSN